jgi:hypothetical protein
MSGTLDRTAALRLGARLLRRRSYQLQASGAKRMTRWKEGPPELTRATTYNQEDRPCC